MANHAIIRIEKRKAGSCSGIQKHHEREKEKYKSNPDIDPDRSYLNYHIVQPTDSYRKMAFARIEAVGAKRRKDSVIIQDGLLTASPEWIRGKSPEEQKEFFDYAYEFLKERYREENFISVTVHLDESTPHMHFVFVPITEDGRLSSKDIMGGPKGMVKLQDDFYEYMSRKYPELSRGIPAKVSHRTHLSSHLYKNAAELYEHYSEIQAAIMDIGMIGNAKKKDAAMALLGRYAPEMAKMDEQLKTTEKHVQKLEERLLDRNSVISRYREETQEKSEEIDKLVGDIYELNRKQQELQKIIDLVPKELLDKLVGEERQRRKHSRDFNR